MLEFDGEDTTKWRPEDGAWTMHLISTISEWCLVVCFCIFIASFSGEFYGIVLQGPFLKLPANIRTV
ncbi:hypothetical protein R5R35_000101 [Gryllus longicercus]|uniref:Uncharacterized protein n=1 Tax=Gryllus longicercus TaxID=2509291 RepID=A0AAN9VHM2_9ORTH